MQSGVIKFGLMERVLFGQPAANAVIEEIERIGASRVFLLVGGTLNRETNEVDKIKGALGEKIRVSSLRFRVPLALMLMSI